MEWVHPESYSVNYVDVSKSVGLLWFSIPVNAAAGVRQFRYWYIHLRSISQSNIKIVNVISRPKWVRVENL